MKKTAGAPKAMEAYYTRTETIDKKLTEIKRLLKAHKAEAQRTPTYWTHAGELGHIDELLGQIVEFLG